MNPRDTRRELKVTRTARGQSKLDRALAERARFAALGVKDPRVERAIADLQDHGWADYWG